ncbi:MAG: AI-2E family transporter [Mangrovicoccus sp.]|nr:AI-2E family transporter [Mangrovicoccus sp.]
MQDNLDARVIDLAIRMGFVALFIFAALSMIAPLAGLLIWALILTVAVYPMYQALARWLGGRDGLAAGIITAVGLAITLGPVAMLISSLIEGITAGAELLREGKAHVPPPPDRILDWPVIGKPLHAIWAEASENLAQLLADHGQMLLSVGSVVLGQIAGLGIGLIIMSSAVLVMGLMFRPGPELAIETRKFANRIFAPQGGDLVDLAGATVRNVSRGIVGVAIIQGLLAGIIMVAFGIKAAGVLALIAMVLAIIQVGPGPILIPTIIWAWMIMSPGMAILFTVLMVPVMLIDNVLKPIFMSRGLDTPMLVILTGVMGGLMAYGLVGLFIGPVILAVFYELFIGWVNAGDETEKADDLARESEQADTL